MDSWTANIWNDNEDECKKTLNELGNWEKVIEIDSLSILKIIVYL